MSNCAISFTVPGEPVAFARSGGNGKVRFTPKRQRDFMALVKLAGSQAMNGRDMLEGPLQATFVATYSIPVGWSKKKQAAAIWKESRPDTTNLVKILEDALNDVVYHDDSQIVLLTAAKKYGSPTGFNVRIEEIQ